MATEMTVKPGEPYEFWRRDHLPVMKKNGFRCQCNHHFQAELPYECSIDEWAASVKKLRCPECGSKKLFMGENRTLAEDRAVRKGKTFAERLKDWQDNGEKGMSSEAMVAHFMGEMRGEYAYPRDLGDLRRCIVMMDRFPEWKNRGSSMKQYPGWEEIGANWDEIFAEFDASTECTSATALRIFERTRS